MRTWAGMLGALLLLASGAARADERAQSQLPVSVGVTSGVIAGSGPWRAAPSINLTAGVELGKTHFSLVGGVSGWTFADVGSTVARSEVLASVGVGMEGSLSTHWAWMASASPTLAVVDVAGSPMGYKPGLLLSPVLEYATRRRTLGLTLGAQTFFFGDGVRLGATAGLVYTFR